MEKEDIVYVSPYEHNAVMRTLHFYSNAMVFCDRGIVGRCRDLRA